MGKLHPTEEGARVPRTWSSPRWLLILLGLGAAVHGWILAQQLAGAPFARVPMVDAEVYWDWAGVLAGGQWQGDTPFFSAPLYPYLLGVLRSLGAGLTAVYLLQLVMHLCTSALVWWVGRERFDGRTGLLAATLWLLAQGPAYANLRILAGPVQTGLHRRRTDLQRLGGVPCVQALDIVPPDIVQKLLELRALGRGVVVEGNCIQIPIAW